MEGRSLCLAVMAIAWSPAVSADSPVRLRSHVLVAPGSVVTLADLVDRRDVSAEVFEELGVAVIGRAPPAGERRELERTALVESLRGLRHGKAPFVLPNKVEIGTVKRELAADDVSTELLTAWRPLCADCRLEIDGLSLPEVRGVRDWTLKIPSELPRGGFSVAIHLVKENGTVLPAWIGGRLVRKRRVPVARRVLSVGETLQATDLNWEWRDTTFATDGAPSSSDEAQGQRLRTGIRAGDILWRGSLEREKAIRRGETVQLRSTEGQWEISLSAVAQQDGYIGDVVQLKNSKTNTPLTGRVVSQGEVRLQ